MILLHVSRSYRSRLLAESDPIHTAPSGNLQRIIFSPISWRSIKFSDDCKTSINFWDRSAASIPLAAGAVNAKVALKIDTKKNDKSVIPEMGSFIPGIWIARAKPNEEPMNGKNIKGMNGNEHYSKIVIPGERNLDSNVRCAKRDNMIAAK